MRINQFKMSLNRSTHTISCLIFALCLSSYGSSACRVGSEKLRQYTQKSIDNLLDVSVLNSFYWQNEPLPLKRSKLTRSVKHRSLSKITGLNITSADTHFNLDAWGDDHQVNASKLSMLQDIFVTCSAGKDRTYTLTLNLELKNPFEKVDFRFKPSQKIGNKETGLFSILLPNSTYTVQLSQHIKYDECLDVKYVQLGLNTDNTIQCVGCDAAEESNLNKMFNKKKAQLDAELDLVLSEKFLLGLKYLLSEQRLDLDLHLN